MGEDVVDGPVRRGRDDARALLGVERPGERAGRRPRWRGRPRPSRCRQAWRHPRAALASREGPLSRNPESRTLAIYRDLSTSGRQSTEETTDGTPQFLGTRLRVPHQPARPAGAPGRRMGRSLGTVGTGSTLRPAALAHRPVRPGRAGRPAARSARTPRRRAGGDPRGARRRAAERLPGDPADQRSAPTVPGVRAPARSTRRSRQLEDEGLVEGDDERGRRTLRLSDAGREYLSTHADEVAGVWAPFESEERRARGTGDAADYASLKPEIGRVMNAAWQIISTGTERAAPRGDRRPGRGTAAGSTGSWPTIPATTARWTCSRRTRAGCSRRMLDEGRGEEEL